ncbi:hypothetical protein C8J57DRAFT_1452979 [Mycena rebaudengoi]|nr:hypothetical protein C8J57DRAFT_1452979 [Mycena rebaudengoi]
MSSYKSAIRAAPPDAPDTTKYRTQARQLQELFPSWSNDDLQSLLAEVGGDVELAATRISDGRAEQWGAVTRKKDKKGQTGPGHVSKDSFSASRGDFRGGRGGRGGGRGGSTRGGAAPRSRGGAVRAAPTNGHTVAAQSPPVSAWADGPPTADKTPDSTAAWGPDIADAAPPPANNWADQLDTPSATATPSSWGGTSTTTTSTWGPDTDVNGSTASLAVPQAKISKTPLTSKMSWAQIARPQEKPTPPPPAPAPAAPPPPAISPAAPEPEPQDVGGWEEPTTVQSPTWEEEAPIAKPSTSAADVWSSTVNEPSDEPKSEPQQVLEQQVEEPPAPSEESALPASEPEPAPPVVSPSPSIKPATAARPVPTSHRSSARYKTIDQPVVMPSSFGSGVEKVGMQFGSLSLGGESSFDASESEPPAPEPQSPPTPQVPATVQHHEPPPPASVPPTSASLGSSLFQGLPQQQQSSSPQIPQHSMPTSVSSPAVSQPPKVVPLAEALASSQPTPLSPGVQQELNHPQQVYAQAATQQQQHMGYIPPHLQQLQQQQHQQQQQQQHQQQQHQQPQHQQQHQSQQQHQYAQHGLPTHIDPSQQQQSSVVAQQQQHQPSPAHAHSSYFRNEPAAAAASPYFHAPTPPAGQAQEANPYGAFGAQGQHQQGAHLGGFGAQDYGHADSQRGFYDTYQQSAFGNRGVLGHEEVKGLPGAQQQNPNAGALPPLSGQSAGQQQQGAGQQQQQQQPQPAAGPQAQQYPPPVPYYYGYPQSQYYGAPYNNAYVPQPFVKYPTMFAGPPVPGSAGPVPGPAVQGQPGSLGVGLKGQVGAGGGGGYGGAQGLYQQQQGGGYEVEYQHQGQGAQGGHGGHALGLGQGGVGGGEYGKQIYGAGQGFMGLGGQGGGGGGPQAARGGSPETAYKPYAAKDVGVGPARGGGVQQGAGQGQQGQGQGQGGPQGQGFYAGNRFSGVGGAGGVGGGGAGGAGPQQSGHHQQGVPQAHLGYSQGQNEFYPYQGRQQQQYWQ